MDLTQFNKLKEMESASKKEFDNPLTNSLHNDVDLHNIGDAMPSPTIIEPVGGSSSTVGASPFPAREDHVHAYETTGQVGLNTATLLSPSLYFLSDTNTGMYRVTTDTIGFAGGGSLNLSISPSQTRVYGNLKVESYVRTEGNIQASENDSNKTVHIGTGIGNYTTWGVVQGKNGSLLLGNSTNGAVYLRNRGNSTLYMGTRNTNDCYIQGTDGVFVFARSPAISNILTTSGFNTLRYDSTFGLVRHFTSSIEIKERVEALDEEFVGETIDKLRPISFVEKWRGEGNEPAHSKEYREKDLRYGFIAEEVWEVADGHLSTVEMKDGKLKPRAWDEGGMMAMAVAEIKSLRKRVEKLENQLTGKENLN